MRSHASARREDRRRLGTALLGVVLAAGSVEAQAWTRWHVPTAAEPTGTVPPPGPAMTYDTVRGRVVLLARGTFEWDGESWSQWNGSIDAHAVTYDRARQRVIAYASNRGWEWDGRQWAQLPIGPTGSSSGMAYDIGRQRTVVLIQNALAGAQTWEWDGTVWSLVPAGLTPTTSLLLYYDFGRQSLMAIAPNGLWDWNGAGWRPRTMTGAPANWSAFAYDDVRQRVMVVSQQPVGSAAPTATWEWNGASWLHRLPIHNPPAGGLMVYDTARLRMVLWVDGNVWEWNGVDWTDRETCPLARTGHAMAGDGIGLPITMFGGKDRNQQLLGDTWEWDGRVWIERRPAVSPSPRSGHSMAFDSVRRRVVLYGGVFDETWEWDGTNWLQRTPVVSPGRSGGPLAYDAARQNTVLLGDSSPPLTWTWDGTNWTQRAPAQSPATAVGAMAYDAARQVIVYQDAQSTLPPPQPPTWEWNGSNWIQRVTAAPPFHQTGAAMAYDAVRGRIVRWGANRFDHGYEYDGNNWTQSTMPARSGLGMAYDAIAQRIVAFGGEGDSIAGLWPVAETLFLGGVASPDVGALGSGCAGSAGVPRLIGPLPSLGDPWFRVELRDAAPLSRCFLGVSSATATLPLGGGCSLYLAGALTLIPGTTSTAGNTAFRLKIPLTPALRGVVAYCQAAIFDPAGGFSGLAFTAAHRLVVGD